MFCFPWVGISPSSSLLVYSIKSHSIIPSSSSVSSLPKMLMQILWYSVASYSPIWWRHIPAGKFQVLIKKKFLCTHNCSAVWFACNFKGQNRGCKQKEHTVFCLKKKKSSIVLFFHYFLINLTHHFVTQLAKLLKSLPCGMAHISLWCLPTTVNKSASLALVLKC